MTKAISLTASEYLKFGDVIFARSDVKSVPANGGTADRYNFLAKLENLRPGRAAPNLCVFRCRPQIVAPQNSFDVSLLERHAFSTQVFIPMAGADRFLVVVCLGKDQPDLSTFRAFLALRGQGISYRPGVWHHPLVAMDRETDFACLVWEDGRADDGEVVKVEPAVRVEI